MEYLFAYLDPGSGSLLIQAVIGVVAGVAFVFRSTLFKLKSGVISIFRKPAQRRIREAEDDA